MNILLFTGPLIGKLEDTDLFPHVSKKLIFPTLQDAIALLEARRQKEQQ